MALKSFEIPLDDSNYIAIELSTYRGHLTSFVIRLMLGEEEGDICVARYDTAHGCPHRDLVSRSGRLLLKEWILDLTFADAANYAIEDFQRNHETYFKQFKAEL